MPVPELVIQRIELVLKGRWRAAILKRAFIFIFVICPQCACDDLHHLKTESMGSYLELAMMVLSFERSLVSLQLPIISVICFCLETV
jgi:hypothetical protein